MGLEQLAQIMHHVKLPRSHDNAINQMEQFGLEGTTCVQLSVVRG